MKHTKLGRTGLDVSPICLGCMSYGASDRGTHSWTLDEETSRGFIRQALDAGINFFDTANVYSDGTSEEFVGRALADMATAKRSCSRRRCTARCGRARTAVASRARRSCSRSTPACVASALHDVVKAGKALHIGASSMFAWQFAKAQHVAESNGWTKFVTMQNHYNLVYREEEREMLPLCVDQGVGVIPWSPLARGFLTRDPSESSARKETDEFGKTLTADEIRELEAPYTPQPIQGHA